MDNRWAEIHRERERERERERGRNAYNAPPPFNINNNGGGGLRRDMPPPNYMPNNSMGPNPYSAPPQARYDPYNAPPPSRYDPYPPPHFNNYNKPPVHDTYKDPLGLVSPETYRNVAPSSIMNSSNTASNLFSPSAFMKAADSPGLTRTMPPTIVNEIDLRTAPKAPFYPSNSDDAFLNDEGGAELEENIDPVLDEVAIFPVYNRRTVSSLFLPENLREVYQARALLCREEVAADDYRYKEIPRNFLSLKPLDMPNAARNATGSMGYMSMLYKVISASDGLTYAIRRVDGVRMRNDVATTAVAIWNRVSHANIIPLRDAFVSNGALYFVHDYQPGAQSLREKYIDRRPNALPENLLWSIICQVLSAVRVIHKANMACRCLSLNRILFAGHGNYSISSVGVIDVLEYESKKTVRELQREDLISFGHVILQLACRSLAAPMNARKSMEICASVYSDDMKNLLMYLLTSSNSIHELLSLPFMTPHFMDEIDRISSISLSLDSELEKECENGRLLRLLFKINSITERSHVLNDSTWSETGNRYLVKLFRDYVFQQVNENGSPRLDVGHVIECLNKVDVGGEEKILLTSRDNQSILLLTFTDVKRCIEQSWMELMQAGDRPSSVKPNVSLSRKPLTSSSSAPNPSTNPNIHLKSASSLVRY